MVDVDVSVFLPFASQGFIIRYLILSPTYLPQRDKQTGQFHFFLE